MLGLKRNKGIGLGLEINNRKAKIVKVSRQNGFKILGFASATLADGVFEAGIISDPEGLGRALIPIVDKIQIQNHRVTAAINNQHVFFHTLVLPKLAKRELRNAAIYQVSPILPIPLEEAVISVCPFRFFKDEDGSKIEIFLVAARRQHIESMRIACQVAGINLAAVEIEALAIQRLLALDINTKVQAYLYLNNGISSFCLFADDTLRIQRSFATRFLKDNEILSDVYKSDSIYKHGFSSIEPNYESDLTANIIKEVTRGLEQFIAMTKDELPEKIIVCGNYNDTFDIEFELNAATGIQVSKPNYYSYINWPIGIENNQLNDLKRDYLIALGSSIREVF